MKKIIALIAISIVLIGCQSKPLAELSIPEDEELTIDVRDEFDPMSILAEVQEDAEVSYKLDEENSKVVITLTKGDKVETLEKAVNIQYPLGEFVTDDIVVTKGEDFDVEEFLNVSDNVEVTKELDEETGKLTVTLTEGDRVETLEMDVTVEAPKIPTRARYYGVNDVGFTYELIVDWGTNTIEHVSFDGEPCDLVDYFTYVSDNMGDFAAQPPYEYNHFKIKWNDDRSEIIYRYGSKHPNGKDAAFYCTLTEVEY